LDDPEKAEKLKQSLPPGAHINSPYKIMTNTYKSGLTVVEVKKQPKKKN
jgi:hypothetical protein